MHRDSIKRAKWLLIGLAGLVLVAAVAQWRPFQPRPAQALENPIEARQDMIVELRKVNERLDRLIAIIEVGHVKVTVVNAEEIRGPAGKAAAQEAGARANPEEPRIIIKRKAAEGE